MASSSKNINMPLIFAITIGATVALLASTMFGMAWYEYEARQELERQVLTGPTHDAEYDKHLAKQQANLKGIDQAIQAVADEHGPKPAPPADKPTDKPADKPADKAPAKKTD